MNIYKVVEVLEWSETGVCECCGQDFERDRETRIEFEIEAANEQAALELSAAHACGILQKRLGIEIDEARSRWENNRCVITLVREIGEAEMMRRANAPTLFAWEIQ